MSTELQSKYLAAVIGAGPAGLYGARQLARDGVRVVLFNRDIKPGGLAEYGIYPTKYKMKAGLRRQFQQVLDDPEIDYYGNVLIGEEGDLTISDLFSMGFQALLVTVGAQGTKWLGLPGEELPKGVYHAKDLVYHYNKLPPFSQSKFYIGRRVALIGMGNVSLDIARWLTRDLKVDQITIVARRGPSEVKFDRKEMESVVANLDLEALDIEIARATPVMEAVGQDPAAAKSFILSAQAKAYEAVSETKIMFDFLASPSRIIGDDTGQVCGLEVEETILIPRNGDTKAKGTGVKRVLDADTVIFCIGDRVDGTFGLPVEWNEYVKSTSPRFPIDETSFEVYDPETQKEIEGIFVAGWAREASSGLVGVARKDGERGARAVYQYLQALPPAGNIAESLEKLRAYLQGTSKPVILKEDIQKLNLAEQAEAERLGLEEFKFATNEEMLEVMGLK